jgi:predicted nuclease of predicted toxin-antitoxin system
MKLLLDACVSSRTLISCFLEDGHDVLTASEIDPRCPDDRLLVEALNNGRVLVTADKDFGELIYVEKHPHGPIVRLVELSIDDQVKAIRELLLHRKEDLVGQVIVTVTRGRVRIRRLSSP